MWLCGYLLGRIWVAEDSRVRGRSQVFALVEPTASIFGSTMRVSCGPVGNDCRSVILHRLNQAVGELIDGELA